MAWIDFPTASADGDAPLHSGVAVDGWHGNLIHAFEQNVFDHQCLHHDGTIYLQYTIGVINEWELFDTFAGIVIPMRKKLDRTWRDIFVGLDGRNSGAGTTDVRVHLRQNAPLDLGFAVDPTSGFVGGDTAYTDLQYTAQNYAHDTGTITPGDIGRLQTPLDSHGISYRHPVTYVSVLVKSTALVTVYLRGLRLREVST